MTDMIRKSDALAACQGMDPEGDINNLPAVVVGVKPLGSDGVKIHPQDILNAAWRDDLGEEGLAMYNRILSALEPVAAPDPAAIREAALKEAAETARKKVECCQSCASVENAILALIAKGAAE